MSKITKNIQVMHPLLPPAAAILPYIQQIDANRWYSNFGPLVLSFEKRLGDFFGVEPGCIVTTSNGTSGLTNTLRAMNLPQGSYCILPSWTFIAVPAAVKAVGLKPYFVDVDPQTWALNPDTVKKALANIKGNVGALLYVAPFGALPITRQWERFCQNTGIPVIIDSAAGFDTLSRHPEVISETIPIMVSLHATKTFGVGEGGIVICKNKALIKDVMQMSNFGFNASRIITIPGTNGKMSEYTAAVAHAELDNWPKKRAAWQNVTAQYIKALKKLPVSHNLSEDRVSSTCNIVLPNGGADAVIASLETQGVAARKWWGQGCHRQIAYFECSRDDLPITEKLSDAMVGLPFHVNLTDEDIKYVCNALKHALQEADVQKRVLDQVSQ